MYILGYVTVYKSGRVYIVYAYFKQVSIYTSDYIQWITIYFFLL